MYIKGDSTNLNQMQFSYDYVISEINRICKIHRDVNTDYFATFNIFEISDILHPYEIDILIDCWIKNNSKEIERCKEILNRNEIEIKKYDYLKSEQYVIFQYGEEISRSNFMSKVDITYEYDGSIKVKTYKYKEG